MGLRRFGVLVFDLGWTKTTAITGLESSRAILLSRSAILPQLLGAGTGRLIDARLCESK